MPNAVTQFSVLTLTDDVERIVNEYIRHGAVPKRYSEDAYHIAIAVINEMDYLLFQLFLLIKLFFLKEKFGYLLSWNFKHIVRKKTRDIVRMVNTLNNLRQIEIMTPAELL